MRNWKIIAAGLGTGLSDEEAGKIAPALEALDAALQPALATLPYEAEPAVMFEPPAEDEP